MRQQWSKQAEPSSLAYPLVPMLGRRASSASFLVVRPSWLMSRAASSLALTLPSWLRSIASFWSRCPS